MNQWRLVMTAGSLGTLLAACASGCSHEGAESSAKEAATPKVVPVTVAPLERKTVERTVDVVGTLRGWEQVTVGSKRTGRVLRVLHDMGDRVKPDEVLVELDPVDSKLAVDQAESKFLGELVKLGITAEQAEEFVRKYGISEELIRGKVAEEAIARVPAVIQMRVARDRALQNLNRQRALSQKGAGTVQELEDHESDYRSSIAAYDNAILTARNVIASAIASRVVLDQARQNLQDMTIRAPKPAMTPPGSIQTSPITYAITKRTVAEGQMIREGEAVAELMIENPLRLWTNIPEKFTDQVRLGQLVRITVAAHPGIEFEGKVARINPAIDPVSRTFQVETLVPNDRRLLRPGGFAKATIITDSQARASIVPIESIVRFAGVTKLFLVENDKARAINDIVTGAEGQGWVEVSSKSLPESAVVVTTGQSQLADGTPVKIRTPEPSAENGRKSGERTETPARPASAAAKH